MELPKFKYHPDPIATDSIKLSDETCQCCERARVYIYNSTIYSEEEVDRICPWCIANGSAAQKYSGLFSDDYSLQQAGISEAIISEVCEKTPGYNSWQQDEWQHHCDDVCEFHGDASKVEFKTLSGEALDRFLNQEAEVLVFMNLNIANVLK